MQKPFSTLSQGGQTRRMACLAHRVLEAYSVPVVKVILLKQVYNRNFRVSAQNGAQYMLRICHPRRTTVEPVQSELLWLAALNQDTNLRVPAPVLNRTGQYVTVIDDPNLPQPAIGVLFHWTNGRFLSRALAPAHLYKVGEAMAHLQNQAAHWIQPAGFTRRRVDNLFCLRQEQDDAFNESIARQAIDSVATVSTPQDGMVIEAVIHRVWAVLESLGEGEDVFGLIHADLHQYNYLFHQGQVGVIDFDDCGFGHWLYDLAVPLYCLQGNPNFNQLRQAFLAGYRQHHALSAEHEAYIETFMILRTLQDMLWDIEERNQPAFRDKWHDQMLGQLKVLRDFIQH